MGQQQRIAEQLSCAICMCTFNYPVTIECGHTFCRFCLLNYTRTKSLCPICRTHLTRVSEHPPQDFVLNTIVEHLNKKQGNNGHKDTHITLIDHFEKLLILDIKCNDLLLPFTKVTGTFELQSPTLIAKLDRFVARQETPFNKYGVVSKISNINQLRYSIYECVIEGRSFCQITNQETSKTCEQTQEFHYRTCQAKVIYEEDEPDPCLLEAFLKKFSCIEDKNLLRSVYRAVDREKLYSKTNLIASYYSMIKLMADCNLKKYKVVTTFDKQKRQNFLRQYLLKIDYDVGTQNHRFVSVKQEAAMRREWFILFIMSLVIAFLLFFNTGLL